ncbi:MAG: DUF3833 domain-containing protein [Pseudomonadota bacterium]
MRLAALLFALTVLAACSSGRPSPDDPLLSDRAFELQEFFNGDLVAHGQFQDRFGTVRRRFTVDIKGTWNGEVLRLTEDFIYEDGTEEQRIWTLTPTGDETWEGSAPGVIGVARGTEDGDSFNWTYTIDLPVPDGTLRVSFDDWMWQLTDDRLLNIAYMERFGIEIGKVIIMFEKL